MITGSLKAAAGRVLLDGEEIQNLPPHRISRLGVATVPEGRRTFVDMSVSDNLMMGAYLPHARKILDRTQEEVLDLFPALKTRMGQRAGTLSGGEQQMLAIGRALMSRPSLLILDELSLGLAPVIVQEIYRVLEKVREQLEELLPLRAESAESNLTIAGQRMKLAAQREEIERLSRQTGDAAPHRRAA